MAGYESTNTVQCSYTLENKGAVPKDSNGTRHFGGIIIKFEILSINVDIPHLHFEPRPLSILSP